MTWLWQIASGEVLHDGLRVGSGYSGHGTAKNDPARVAEHDTGPIPPGTYAIGKPEDHPALGPLAMPLTAQPGTETFGRSAFFIHGDSTIHPGEASHGCIILGPAARRAIAASPDRVLKVAA